MWKTYVWCACALCFSFCFFAKKRVLVVLPLRCEGVMTTNTRPTVDQRGEAQTSGRGEVPSNMERGSRKGEESIVRRLDRYS